MKRRGQPKPRPCLIAALEFLGLDDPAAPEGRSQQALSAIESNLDRDPELVRLLETDLLITGRHAVYVAPIKRSGLLSFWALLNLVHLQADLISHGVLVRGAITLGSAMVGGGLVSGRGIDLAERLRNEVAHFPRVIVDPALLIETERNPDLRQHPPMMELGYVRRLLREDADGMWFVDYLRAFQSEVDEPHFYIDFLREHRKLVARRLEGSTTFDHSSRATTWLWHYHSSVVEGLDEKWRLSDQEKAALRIPAAGPLLYAFPPSAKAP